MPLSIFLWSNLWRRCKFLLGFATFLCHFAATFLSHVCVCSCALGYWGDPMEVGGRCSPCECSDNIDMNDPLSCDRNTGECLRCITPSDHSVNDVSTGIMVMPSLSATANLCQTLSVLICRAVLEVWKMEGPAVKFTSESAVLW